MRQGYKTILLWIILILMFLSIYNVYNNAGGGKEVAFSAFLDRMEKNEVRSVTVKGSELSGQFADGSRFETRGIVGETLVRRLQEGKAVVRFEKESAGLWTQLLVSWLPIGIFFLLSLWFIRHFTIRMGRDTVITGIHSRAVAEALKIWADGKGGVAKGQSESTPKFEKFEKIVSMFPLADVAQVAILQLALIRYELGDLDAAREYTESFISIAEEGDSLRQVALELRGRILMKEGKVDEAAEVFKGLAKK